MKTGGDVGHSPCPPLDTPKAPRGGLAASLHQVKVAFAALFALMNQKIDQHVTEQFGGASEFCTEK